MSVEEGKVEEGMLGSAPSDELNADSTKKCTRTNRRCPHIHAVRDRWLTTIPPHTKKSSSAAPPVERAATSRGADATMSNVRSVQGVLLWVLLGSAAALRDLPESVTVVTTMCGTTAREQIAHWQQGLCYSALVADNTRWNVIVLTDAREVPWEPCTHLLTNVVTRRVEFRTASEDGRCPLASLILHKLLPAALANRTVVYVSVDAVLGGNPEALLRQIQRVVQSPRVALAAAPTAPALSPQALAALEAKCPSLGDSAPARVLLSPHVMIVQLERYARSAFLKQGIAPFLTAKPQTSSDSCVLNRAFAASQAEPTSSVIVLPCEVNAGHGWTRDSCPCLRDLFETGDLSCVVYGPPPHDRRDPQAPILSPIQTRAFFFKQWGWDASFLQRRLHASTVFPPIKTREELGRLLEREGKHDGVEVGVQAGWFAKALLQNWPSASKYVLVDLWKQQAGYVDSANVNNDRQEALMAETLERLQPFANKIDVCRDYSTQCATRLRSTNAAFDFIFIDARHDYQGVVEDLFHYYPLLRPGGILAGHDFVNQEDGPAQTKQNWTVSDSFVDVGGRAVRGAVLDFANLIKRQVVITYREDSWNTWVLRK